MSRMLSVDSTEQSMLMSTRLFAESEKRAVQARVQLLYHHSIGVLPSGYPLLQAFEQVR
jgi:hypothetical protein